ncbi:MAG: hypothetical protein ACRC7R_06310 [Sarcina sp.]
MEKENTKKDVSLKLLDAENIWKELYGKELVSKKTILEYIDIIKDLKQDEITKEQIEETYKFIYKSIEGMISIVKTNTIMYLKNQLKSKLGKYVTNKDPKETNYFLDFFKEAYPPNKRKKDYTYVLMDINRITKEQIWNTLTYINAWCLNKNNILSLEQKKDIIKMINVLLKSKDIKYINQIKSLEKLQKVLSIEIVTLKSGIEAKEL